MTTMSTIIASMFLAVSRRVSPFFTLDVDAEKFSVSAESRFSASSNDMRVRVLASKKRLTMVTPRRVGTFLTGRSRTSRNFAAVSRMARISSRSTPSRPRRCFRVQRTLSSPRPRVKRKNGLRELSLAITRCYAFSSEHPF